MHGPEAPRSPALTQPVELFGRIGSRTRYQLWPGATSRRSSTSTMFCVWSVVQVVSRVTSRDPAFGCE